MESGLLTKNAWPGLMSPSLLPDPPGPTQVVDLSKSSVTSRLRVVALTRARPQEDVLWGESLVDRPTLEYMRHLSSAGAHPAPGHPVDVRE
jgi:hypothetical protein